MTETIEEKTIDSLKLRIYENRTAMGAGSAEDVGDRINDLLARREFVYIIFAAAPSQNEFLYFLSKRLDVSWNRVNAFHMDEYAGLEKDSPQLFGNFRKD